MEGERKENITDVRVDQPTVGDAEITGIDARKVKASGAKGYDGQKTTMAGTPTLEKASTDNTASASVGSATAHSLCGLWAKQSVVCVIGNTSR